MSTEWHLYSVGDLEFEAEGSWLNPYLQNDLVVVFRSPTHRRVTVTGFWDGERRFRVRFAPDEPGVWHWHSMASDAGLHGLSGVLTALDPSREPCLRHGFLTVAPARRRFAYSDGTPFFWLGDTVWSAAAHAGLEEWEQYLSVRSRQGFNVAQINSLPQWDASAADYRKPFAPLAGEEGSSSYDFDQPEPAYFRTLDRIVRAASEHGIRCAIVVLWFNYVAGTNKGWTYPVPRHAFSTEQAYRYAKMLAARYSAHGAIWIVSGDTDAPVEGADEVFDAAARGILDGSSTPPLLTAHLNGGIATPESWSAKSWLDFHMFQSCHFRDSADRAVRYAGADRSARPSRPVLNGEPVYDSIRLMDPDNGRGERGSREYLRRVAWTSILSGACAGLTYGAHGLWPWHRAGQPYAQTHYGQPLSWQESLELPSGEDMATMKRVLESFVWSDLVPQPFGDSSEDAALPPGSVRARAPEGFLVIYTPARPERPIGVGSAHGSIGAARWVSPTTGETRTARIKVDGDIALASPYPWEGDGVLIVERDPVTA